MTRARFKELFPNATESTIAVNCDPKTHLPTHDPRKAAEPQQIAGNDVVEAARPKAKDRRRFLIRITSIRKRLLDEDNLVSKFHTDVCRHAGILPTDAPGRCRIETRQRKAAKGEAETVTIEVYQLN